jgi:hypothetical protein
MPEEEHELCSFWQTLLKDPVGHPLVREGQDEVIGAVAPDSNLLLFDLKEASEVVVDLHRGDSQPITSDDSD